MEKVNVKDVATSLVERAKLFYEVDTVLGRAAEKVSHKMKFSQTPFEI